MRVSSLTWSLELAASRHWRWPTDRQRRRRLEGRWRARSRWWAAGRRRRCPCRPRRAHCPTCRCRCRGPRLVRPSIEITNVIIEKNSNTKTEMLLDLRMPVDRALVRAAVAADAV